MNEIINNWHETFDYDEEVKSLPPICKITLDSSALQPNVATTFYHVCLVSQWSRPYRLLINQSINQDILNVPVNRKSRRYRLAILLLIVLIAKLPHKAMSPHILRHGDMGIVLTVKSILKGIEVNIISHPLPSCNFYDHDMITSSFRTWATLSVF